MKLFAGLIFFVTFWLQGVALQACEEADLLGPNQSKDLTAIDLSPFASCIHHWRNLRDDSRWIRVEKDQESYEAIQVEAIVENILLFQRDNGGWPKDYDMTAVLSLDQRNRILATRSYEDTSFDNGNIHSQVGYLAQAIHQVPKSEWKNGCERGLDFILRSQYENGGFPQRYPNTKGYYGHITFNDGVMIGILNLLQDIADGEPHYAWIDQSRKKNAMLGLSKGIDCILRCQIIVDGKKTGWCQQHDSQTLQPQSARSFELASLCPQETTDIVRFLMRQKKPSDPVIEAIEAALDWLKLVQQKGIQVRRIPSSKESYLRHDVDFDVVVIEEKDASPIWARHYEIGTNRPIFAGRDGVKKYDLASIERERRTGTAWYGAWPQVLIDVDYLRWKQSH